MAEHIAPEGKLDLAGVTSLHAEILGKLGQDIVLDLSKVTHFGALCMQTCIAAGRSARETGNEFSIVNASDHVLGQINSMGMTPAALAEGTQ